MNDDFVPKGYYVGASYVGFLPGNKKMLFPTEQEYLDYIRDYVATIHGVTWQLQLQ